MLSLFVQIPAWMFLILCFFYMGFFGPSAEVYQYGRAGGICDL